MVFYCDCDDWKPGMNHINGFIVFGHTHDLKFKKEFVFRYCPWCGKKLIEEKNDK